MADFHDYQSSGMHKSPVNPKSKRTEGIKRYNYEDSEARFPYHNEMFKKIRPACHLPDRTPFLIYESLSGIGHSGRGFCRNILCRP